MFACFYTYGAFVLEMCTHTERWALISFIDICVPVCHCICGYTLTILSPWSCLAQWTRSNCAPLQYSGWSTNNPPHAVLMCSLRMLAQAQLIRFEYKVSPMGKYTRAKVNMYAGLLVCMWASQRVGARVLPLHTLLYDMHSAAAWIHACAIHRTVWWYLQKMLVVDMWVHVVCPAGVQACFYTHGCMRACNVHMHRTVSAD